MPYSTEIYNTIKALKQAIPCAFVFQESFKTLLNVLEIVLNDVKQKPKWYDEKMKESFKLVVVLRKILRFINTKVNIVSIQRKELIYLRKALVYTALNKLREEFLELIGEMKSLLFSTVLCTRLRKPLSEYFSLEKSYNDSLIDFQMACEGASQIFQTIQTAFPNHDVSSVSEKCLEQLPDTQSLIYPNFSVFESKVLFRSSFNFAEYILSLDPQNDRILSKVNLSNIKNLKFDFRGTFGDIMNTTLKYNKTNATTDILSLQLVQKDTVCKVSNEGKARLAGEISLLISEKHPTLINILGFTIHWGALCIALEPLERSLKEVLHGSSRCGKLKLQEFQILSVFDCLSDALVYLHSKGLVHGDIRPENIFIPASLCNTKVTQNQYSAKLSNLCYGLNHFESRWKAVSTESALQYRSPEVIDGDRTTAAGDVYSLAVCLWEASQNDKRPFYHLVTADGLSKSKLIRSIKIGDRPRFNLATGGEFSEPQWIIDLVTQSWVSDAWERPLSSYWKSYMKAVIKKMEVDLKTVNSEFGMLFKRNSVASRASLNAAEPATANLMLRKRHPSYASMTSLLAENPRNTVELVNKYETLRAGNKKTDAEFRKEVELELREFFTKHDEKVLKDKEKFDTMVDYCVNNGMEKMNERMLTDYDAALPRFDDSETIKNERKKSRNMRKMFGFKKNKKTPAAHERVAGSARKTSRNIKAPKFRNLRSLGSRNSVWNTSDSREVPSAALRRSVASFIEVPDDDGELDL